MIQVIGDEPENGDVEADVPTWEQATVEGAIHSVADTSALTGNEPGEKVGKAVAIKVLIGEEDGDVEDPCEDWVGNAGRVEEGDEVVRSEDRHDLKNAEGV